LFGRKQRDGDGDGGEDGGDGVEDGGEGGGGSGCVLQEGWCRAAVGGQQCAGDREREWQSTRVYSNVVIPS